MSNWFEETVENIAYQHHMDEGREFEASVREALSEFGFDTTFVADAEIDGEVRTNYRTSTFDGDYGLEFNRQTDEVEVYTIE